MDPDRSNIHRAVRFALPITFGLPLLGGLASMVSSGGGRRMSMSAAFAIVATTILVAFIVVTRRHIPRAGIVAAVGAALWAAMIGLGVTLTLEEPIVRGSTGLHCGTGLMGLYIVGVPILAILTLGLGLGLGAALARRSADRFMRGLAFAAVAVSAAALAFQIPRARMPEPDAYLGTLRVERTIAVEEGVAVDGLTVRYERVASTLTPEGAEPWTDCQITGFTEPLMVRSTVGNTEPCPRVRFRRDPASSLLIVESDSACLESRDDCWYPLAAIRTSDGDAIEVTPRSVAERLAAPLGWRIGAAFGFASGLGLLLYATRLRRRASAEDAEDANHRGEGWIELDGRSFLSPAAASLPSGPIVLFGIAEREASYRDVGAPRYTGAEAGTSAERREAGMAFAASVTATALAAATLGAAPLVIARLFFGF